MRQHYILTTHPLCPMVFEFIERYNLEHELHLNRTRFWVPVETSVYTEFALRFTDSCPEVLESPDDYAIGRRDD